MIQMVLLLLVMLFIPYTTCWLIQPKGFSGFARTSVQLKSSSNDDDDATDFSQQLRINSQAARLNAVAAKLRAEAAALEVFLDRKYMTRKPENILLHFIILCRLNQNRRWYRNSVKYLILLTRIKMVKLAYKNCEKV
jgi:hypothetical protein